MLCSQLAAQQQSESTLVNSDMDTTLSGKQQQSAMSELVDNLSASQNSTTDIYNPGKSPNKVSFSMSSVFEDGIIKCALVT